MRIYIFAYSRLFNQNQLCTLQSSPSQERERKRASVACSSSANSLSKYLAATITFFSLQLTLTNNPSLLSSTEFCQSLITLVWICALLLLASFERLCKIQIRSFRSRAVKTKKRKRNCHRPKSIYSLSSTQFSSLQAQQQLQTPHL